MRTAKRAILILLLLSLLAGAVLLDPLVRFTLDLYTERFEAAEAVYLSRLQSSDRLDQEAKRQLQLYAERQLTQYYYQKIPFEQVINVLTSLSRAKLPQEDVSLCLRDVQEIETVRVCLNQANAHYEKGEYAEAIPLYRRAQTSDKAAAFWLDEAETQYRNELLDKFKAAMDLGQHEAAKALLLEGQRLLKKDDADLAAALADVHRMEEEEAYAALTDTALAQLYADGPRSTFQYVANLRLQAPDDYALVYLEQRIRHAYEDDICAQAQALQDGGDAASACALLEEGLMMIDSARMKTLHARIRATMALWLVDMPLLRDATGNNRMGTASTVARDAVLTDIGDNEYVHSLYADSGSITYALEGAFGLFSGIVAFPADETSDIYRQSATMQVFADGRLLAEFKNIDSGSSPLPFSLPVEGVGELTLLWTSEGANGWKDWGRFATLFDGKLFYASPAA